jgi:hypothetical protein
MLWCMLTVFPSLAIKIVAALWLGGLVAIDLIETPAKFRIKSISRSSAVELGQEVFRSYGFLEMAFGVVLIVSILAGSRFYFFAGALLGCISLFVSPLLRHRLRGLVSASDQGLRNPQLKKYHLAYVALDLLKMLLLALLLLLPFG